MMMQMCRYTHDDADGQVYTGGSYSRVLCKS